MGRTDRPLDNPLNWSLYAGRLFGIRIRIHVAFFICAVVLVWMEIPKDAEIDWSLGRVLIDAIGIYVLLFVIVLLHEFGHCFGARSTGGEADEILIWPLGGLAYANPPHNAAAHMITTVAGPLVNVALCLICTLVLVGWTGRLGAVPWNPLHPMMPVDRSVLLEANTVQIWIIRFYGLSYFLLLINLLPIFPFDGGRVVQAWLWPRKGYQRSMEIATSTGMIGAIAIGLFGLFTEQSWLLMMIAVFGYFTCWQTRRMLREGDAFALAESGFGASGGYGSLSDSDPEPRPGFLERRRARKAAVKAGLEKVRRELHERAMEAVLRKISLSGIDSLTSKERRVLEEETQRQRAGSDQPADTPRT